MNSANQAVNLLHETYCSCMALDLPLHPADERRWLSAVLAGVEPDMIRLVITERRKRIREGVRFPESLYIRNLVGSDEAIADMMNEAAVIQANARIKVMDKGKASVMRATGRSVEVGQSEAKPVGHYIVQLRRAAG